jgi:NAD(P)-dependent dehydrogenase (short-subunit alcohol dehydrogenase family)
MLGGAADQPEMSRTFRGSACIVTGASGGIGEEVAVALARQGARVTLAARREGELERVAARCREAGGETLAVPTDVTDREQCSALVVRAVERFGRLDLLVNNAGQGVWARLDEIRDFAVFERMLAVNYLSAVWCTLAALPRLKEAKGRIVAVCSLAGRTGVPLRGPYSAAKHAMAGFFDTLRIELDGSGVSVTLVHPGFVATGSQARNLGPDGRPLGKMPITVTRALSAAECAAIIVDAAARRRREVAPTLLAKLMLWLKVVAPELVDRRAARAIRTGR